jgi:hypothetical protein
MPESVFFRSKLPRRSPTEMPLLALATAVAKDEGISQYLRAVLRNRKQSVPERSGGTSEMSQMQIGLDAHNPP